MWIETQDGALTNLSQIQFLQPCYEPRHYDDEPPGHQLRAEGSVGYLTVCNGSEEFCAMVLEYIISCLCDTRSVLRWNVIERKVGEAIDRKHVEGQYHG